MHTCQKCGRNYPSRYHFVTADTCNECFAQLDTKAQKNLLAGVESAKRPGSSIRSIDGHKLVCPVCGRDTFWARKTLMNTPGMTFWGIEWANRSADNYICDSCGYVMWFMRAEE